MIKILIELPTWLGDAVMTSPAIENLIEHFDDIEITLMGSFISIEALKNHPKVIKTYVLDKRFVDFYKALRGIEEFDIFFSFRSSFRAKFTKFCISSKRKYQFNKNIYTENHQVVKYNNFINDSLKIKTSASSLVLHTKNHIKVKTNKLLGINPGASYGSSKRWYPKEFAAVARDLSSQYDIIIFGGPEEKDIAADIEKYLIVYGVQNYQNLADKTSLADLISQISNLDLFITGDSGPMHLAAVFQIPTVSIFGSTNDKETSQWMNAKSIIVKKSLECQPCMKRECPLNHHNCMKQILSPEVLSSVNKLV